MWITLSGKPEDGDYDLIPKGKHAKLQAELDSAKAMAVSLNKDVLLVKECSIKLQAENEKLKDALEHIIEYWNGSDNYKATTDALREIIETAEQALQGKKGSE